VRFDPCYYVGYECNLRRLEEYQNLSNDLRELYQTPSIAEVCDIAGMKRGVFSKAGPLVRTGPSRSVPQSTTRARMIAIGYLGAVE
jgi:putative glutathione S-transferase